MKLVEMTVSQFTEVLGSNAPAPGGGSAAALAGANGIALTKMVCELTVGKKKYAEYEKEVERCLVVSTKLQKELLEAIDKDTQAFNVVSAVFTLPKETDEQKAVRKEELQKALKIATQSPFAMMELMLESLQVTQTLVGKSNVNAVSDLGVAALNLKAGLQGAWLNVLINLSGIKDEDFIRQYKEEGVQLLEQGTAIADEVYQAVLQLV